MPCVSKKGTDGFVQLLRSGCIHVLAGSAVGVHINKTGTRYLPPASSHLGALRERSHGVPAAQCGRPLHKPQNP
ncbi:hypothetical protein EVA_07311 [gut metagenome]|uniref:Uncharacterized protein n=1 Tax=gut metagenome TaxID=749906 RepID=J9GBA5_9ZZZZ